MTGDNRLDRIIPDDFFATGDLKILICYLMASVKEPIPATEISQLFHYEGIANFFDTQTAIAELQRSRHITSVDGRNELFIITNEGEILSKTLKENISITLRNKVYNAVVKMLGRYKAERDAEIDIKTNENGSNLICKLTSNKITLFSFSIMLPNESQANVLKEKILKEPNYYYDSFIKILTEDLLENKG